MDTSDLKKLITGFLILSTLSGALTLIFLNSGNQSAPSPSNQIEAVGQNPPAVYGEQSRTIGKNAFVEQLPQNFFAQTNAEVTANKNLAQAGNEITDTSNLTRNFANIFAQETIAHNPDGPQTDSNGKPTTLNLPTEDSTAVLIQQAVASSSFGIDEKISNSELKILKAYTSQDTRDYFTVVTSVLADLASSTARIDTTNPSTMPDTLAVGQLVFESSLVKLRVVSVPQPLADFHKSLLRFFANQRKVFEIAGNYQIDPIKTILVIQNEKEIINRDTKTIQNELQKIPKQFSYYLKKDSGVSLINKVFGIEKAHAEVITAITPDSDALSIANFISTVGNWLKEAGRWIADNAKKIAEWAYTTALRIAVKLLIDTFQNQVVNWIAGNGNPKFITDWKGFLKDVGDKAAGQALSDVYPFLCSGIGPLIRVAVLPVPTASTAVRCTLTQIVGNLTDFYNSFENGGWIAYGATLQPQNNFFGGLLQTSEILNQAVGKAVGAAGQQSVASQGFLSQTKETGKCVKYNTVYGPFGEPPGTLCEEKEKIITTPGSTVGASLSKSLGWSIEGIFPAQRFEELVGAIVNASINRMMKEGVSALTEASNPAPANFDNAIPNGVADPGDISALRSSLKSLIDANKRQGTFKRFDDINSADSDWLALKPKVVTALNQVASSCSSLTSDAKQKVTTLNSLEPSVRAELLTASANTYDAFKTSADAATSTTALNALLDRLQNLDSVAADATVAQARLTRLQALSDAANADLVLNACNVALPNP